MVHNLVPNVEQDDATKTLLRLINTSSESLGYRQTEYTSELIVSKVHSPAFTSNSLILYDVRIHRSSLKRPDIVRVRIERSDIHSTKEKKRPTDDSEILEGVFFFIVLTAAGNAVLIDWGFAFIADQQRLSRGFTGTPLFASIRITRLLTPAESVEYCARDDFEALFYVLLYCVSGKKLPWSKSNSSQELLVGKQLAMTANWKTTLDRAAPIFHNTLEQMHQILFPENLYNDFGPW
jgi:hypothetical protein